MTVAVIGASGYLGQYVTDELLDRDREVIAFDLEPSSELQDCAEQISSLVAVRGDMTTFADVSNAITAHNVTAIIQLAYFGTPTTGLLHAAEQYPYQASNANITGFNNVVEAARQLDVETVVCASSTVVYGPPEFYADLGIETIDEDSPTAPESLYGACKVHNEYIAGIYREQYDLDLACIRLPLIYGPQRYPGAQPFVVELFEEAAAGSELTLEDGDSTWDLLYERDIGPLFADVLEASSYEHTAYNVVGHTVTVRELAALAEAHGDPTAEINVTAGDEAPLPAPLDDSRLRQELGYKPTYDADSAVADYLETLAGRADAT